MSEELTRDEKIATILEIIRVSQEHHTTVRELFDDLSDETVDRVYNHSLTMKPHFDDAINWNLGSGDR